MGKVGMSVSGGKVTAENLTANNIKKGVTVKVTQGHKTVKQITGEYAPTFSFGFVTRNSGNGEIDFDIPWDGPANSFIWFKNGTSNVLNFRRVEVGNGHVQGHVGVAGYDQYNFSCVTTDLMSNQTETLSYKGSFDGPVKIPASKKIIGIKSFTDSNSNVNSVTEVSVNGNNVVLWNPIAFGVAADIRIVVYV